MQLCYLALLTIQLFVDSANAYQYPIQNNLPVRNRRLTNDASQQQAYSHPIQPAPMQLTRRYDIVDRNVLRDKNLDEVIETISRLINTHNEELKKRPQDSASVDEYGDPEYDQLDSEITHAIENLKKVQAEQQAKSFGDQKNEKTNSNYDNAEPIPQPSALTHTKEDTLVGLIQELTQVLGTEEQHLKSFKLKPGHIFPSDTISQSYSEDRNSQMPTTRNFDQDFPGSSQSITDPTSTTTRAAQTLAPSSTTTMSPTMFSAPSTRISTTNSSSPQQDEQSLFIGQLDSLASELGDTLTSDFYAFHEDSNGSKDKNQFHESIVAQPELVNHSQMDTTSTNKFEISPSNDLESAAQTRNSVSQRNNFPSIQPGTLRFDFSQPIATNFQPLNSPNQDNLVRNMRQEPNTLGITSAPLASSTSLPLQNVDNFWRPTIDGGDSTNTNVADLSQQYFRARDPQQNMASLPPSRFQNLNGGFSQSGPSDRQPNHIHYTGHSLIASSDFLAPQLPGANREFASTQSPIISVLSGRDTGNGGSVSWNPPAPTTFRSPNQQQSIFSHQFSPVDSVNRDSPRHFLSTDGIPSTNIQAPSPNFANEQPKPNRVEVQPSNTQPTRGINYPASVINDLKFPTSTTHWSPSEPLNSPTSTDRTFSNSQPRTSISPQSDDAKLDLKEDYLNPTTTFSPLESDTSPPPQTTTSTSSSTPIYSPNTTPISANTTKKDDTIVYYYYYYDDNKNATVVAKNMSAPQTGSSAPLDPTLEADGGLEDTPYMDDPAPFTDLGGSPIRHTSTTSTSTTTTTTTHSPIKLDDRAKAQSSLTPSITQKFNHNFANNENIFASTRIPDSKRIPVSEQVSGKLQHQVSISLSSTTPNSLPPSTTPRTGVRSHSINSEATSSPKLTEVSTRSSEIPDQQNPISQSVPSNKLQQDLIKNVLNGRGPKTNLPTRQSSSSTTSTSPTPSSSQSRIPLSNASRYGTNNNGVIDPLGLDPTSPVNHPQNSLSSGLNNQHSRNQGQTFGVHNTSKKLSPQITSTFETPTVPKQNNRLKNQDSSSARNQNQQVRSSTPTTPHQSTTISSSTRQGVNNAPAAKQTFSEAELPTMTDDRVRIEHNNQPTNKKVQQDVQVERTETQNISKADLNRVVSNQDPAAKMKIQSSDRVVNIDPKTSTTPAPQPTEIQLDRIVSTNQASTQTSVTTSVSKSFVTPQQIQITTSVSPPTISSTSVTSSMTQSTSVTPVTTVPTTTVSKPDSSPSTAESTDSTNTSTRRKFGNRNNRFQTRLNSISSSGPRSTSTTTTTPAPSTSTTRRPISSTTRKSSKQLFAGRRRLGSTQSPAEVSNSVVSSGTNENPETQDQTSVTPKLKFGNQLSAGRLRTTSSPSSQTSESATSTTRKPNVFGSQRASTQNRSSFRVTKPNSTTPSEVNTILNETSPIRDEHSEKVPTSENPIDDKTVTEANVSSTDTSNLSTGELRSNAPPQNVSEDKKESPTTTVNVSSSTTSVPTSTSAPDTTTSRNKPRVRPLFASRQRNSTLFGNRRNNTA